MRRAGKALSGFWAVEGGPYGLLILMIGTIFLLEPLTSAGVVRPLFLKFAFALVLVVGAFNVSSRTSHRCLALVLAVVSVFTDKLGLSLSQEAALAVEILISFGMLAAFTVLLIKRFLPRGIDAAHRVAGAVAVYLLLAIMWARLYQLVELLSPGAFRVPQGESLTISNLTYFSFVTLATLGYGDISPVNVVARNLAVLEGIIGQLYLVILISRLVSEGVVRSETK